MYSIHTFYSFIRAVIWHKELSGRIWPNVRGKTEDPALPVVTENAFFPVTESEAFRNRWHNIQASFVDKPRPSVEKADQLVGSMIQPLAELYA